MKSIEERAEEWDANWRGERIELQALSIHHYIHSALTELAADLQAEQERSINALNDTLSLNLGQLMEAQNRLAEKENEVAELKESLTRLGGSHE